jgi:hypothetical protein
MKSQNQTEKDTKTLDTTRNDPARKSALPSGTERELTDDEIASVAEGSSGGDRPMVTKFQ